VVVGCYYRVSTQGQEKKGTSLEEQKAKGEAFAKKNGWDYRSIGDVQSGKDPTRKGYLEILDAIEGKTIDVVWIVDEDRFSRDAVQGLNFLNSLIAKKIRLFVGDIERDPADPSTYTLLGIKFIFAQQEWSVIRERLLGGRIRRANEGKRRIALVYGYDSFYDTDGIRKLKKNPAEAKIVNFIFSEFRKGVSQRQIAFMLNSKGIPTKQSGKYVKQRKSEDVIQFAGLWSQASVKCILKRPEYIGKVWDWEHKKLLTAHQGYIPSIIDEELWDWVEANISRLSATRNRNGINATDHELSRVIKCQYCEAVYYFGSHNKPYYCHELKNAIQKKCENRPKNIRENIEEVFNICFASLFIVPWEIEAYLSDFNASLQDLNKEILDKKEVLKIKIEKNNGSIEKLVSSLETLNNDPTVIKRIKERRLEIEKWNNEIEQMITIFDDYQDDLEDEAKDFSLGSLEQFSKGTSESRRFQYLSMIESCTVRDKVVSLVFKNKKKYIITLPYRTEHSVYIIDSYFGDDYQISFNYSNHTVSILKERFYQLYKGKLSEEMFEIGKGLVANTSKLQ
jgi:DNA invertase Pin-like site-specific DNA recombinase